jgi:hypothetical protein
LQLESDEELALPRSHLLAGMSAALAVVEAGWNIRTPNVPADFDD